MTPTEWFYEYVAEMPDIRLMFDPLNHEPILTVLVLGQHQDPDESNTSYAHHFETIAAIRSKMQPMNTHVAGEPAPVTRNWMGIPREEIGAPECPLMHRWTLLDRGKWKLLLHHFLPNATDTDYHDHPRGFVTFVLYGGYTDRTPWGDVDSLTMGDMRRRKAEHAHITTVGPRGCWTVVIMGPKQRKWGFWRDGAWWHWQAFEREFGLAMRCERED